MAVLCVGKLTHILQQCLGVTKLSRRLSLDLGTKSSPTHGGHRASCTYTKAPGTETEEVGSEDQDWLHNLQVSGIRESKG